MSLTLPFTLRVSSIRSRSEPSGVVFSGVPVDVTGKVLGKHIAVTAKARVIRNVHDVQKGQLWSVEGEVTLYEYQRNGMKAFEQQMDAVAMYMCRPAGENLITYLADSPRFVGIGRVKAQKLWASLGKELFVHIKTRDVKTLSNFISAESAQILCNEFALLDVSEALLYLDQISIPRKAGHKVVKFYGGETIAKLKDNPYRLIAFEASWAKVDKFAIDTFGIEPDDKNRLVGAIEECLYACLDAKDTAIKSVQLKIKLKKLLGHEELVDKALALGASEGDFYRSDDGEIYYPASSYIMERYVAERLKQIQNDQTAQISLLGGSIEDVLTSFEANEGLTLNDAQRKAVHTCCANAFSMIIGGAGTGKTTVLKAVYAVLSAVHGSHIKQAALAGRAAKRMIESTEIFACTIAAFLKGSDEDLTDNTVVVVDEGSMVDLILMYRLLRKLPEGCRLILVGDHYQLPPIGAGLVFHVLVDDPSIAKTELVDVRRQDKSSGIPQVAADIRRHEVPDFLNYRGLGVGVCFVCMPEHKLNETVVEVYEDLGGNGSNFDDVQIISATRKGAGGVDTLNTLLHDRYRADDEPLDVFSEEYGNVRFQLKTGVSLRNHDLVIQTQNDYGKDLMNGTLGRIINIDGEENGDGVCTVEFEGAAHILTASDLEGLDLGYAITVHKAQGSQFDRIVVPVRAARNLDQAMLYTAVTRGVQQVVIVGHLDAAYEAIKSLSSAFQRQIGLRNFL